MNWLEELLKGMRGNTGALQLGGANEGKGGVMMGGQEGNGLGGLLKGLFGGQKAGPDAEADGKVSFNGGASSQAPMPPMDDSRAQLLGGLLKFSDEDKKDAFLRNGLDFSLNLASKSSEMRENNNLLGNLADAGRATLASSDDRAAEASQNLFRKAQLADSQRKSSPMYQATSAMASKGYVPNPDGSFSRLPGLDAMDQREIEREERKAQAGEERDNRRFEQQQQIIQQREDARAARDERTAANKPMSPTDKKQIWEGQETVQTIEQSLANLDRLEALNGRYEEVKDPSGATTRVFRPGNVISGATSGARLTAGRNLPEWLLPDGVINDEQIRATGEYENLTKADSLTKLKTVLTGPTSDRDVQTVTELGASLEKTPEERAQIISNSRAALLKQRDFQKARLQDMGAGMPGQNPMAPGGVDRGPLAPIQAPSSMPTARTPQEAASLPADVEYFIGPDGKPYKNKNYRSR